MRRARESYRHALRPAMTLLARLADLASRPWRARIGEVERRSVRTADGWELPLYRVPAPERRYREPILMLHGLAANHVPFLFPGRSLARSLAGAGFDVSVAVLRGGGEGARPPAGRLAWDWDLEDHVTLDLPAIVGGVLAASGARRLFWIGHSMGGVLLYMYGIRFGCDEIAGAIPIASSLDYKVGTSGFAYLALFRRWLDRLPWFPFGTFSRLGAPLAGLVRTDLARFDHHPENLEPRLARIHLASTYADVSPALLASLATTFDPEGFAARDLAFRYLARADRFTAPVLALAGDVDRQLSPDSVEATVAALGSSDSTVRVFGPASGDSTHYGHCDLIIGRRAPEETWPAIRDWIEARATRGG